LNNYKSKMKKRSSKAVSVVLITAALAGCAKPQEEKELKQRVFMRADESAPYTEVTEQYGSQHRGGGMGSALLWYMAFRPLMGGNMGYASQGLAAQSNVGKNAAKANSLKTQTARGGFGTTAKSGTSAS
jgi:hypothetical protein